MTTWNRTLAIGMAIEAELCREVNCPQIPQDRADHLTVGIDGPFVKVKREGKQGRQHFEILTGRIERARVFSKDQRMSPTAIVENKRLGHALSLIKAAKDVKHAPKVQSNSEKLGYKKNPRHVYGPDYKPKIA